MLGIATVVYTLVDLSKGNDADGYPILKELVQEMEHQTKALAALTRAE